MNLPLDSIVLVLACLGAAVSLRPWRMLRGPLLQPAAAALALLPVVWAAAPREVLGISLQLSGSCLLVLLLGWPLAVLVLAVVALLAAALGGLAPSAALDMLVWQGLMPATAALCIGWLVRHALPPHPFVYLLARAFIGTVVALVACGVVRSWHDSSLAAVGTDGALVARLLLSFGEAIITGMLTTLFVVYRPQWVATFSDRLYLRPGPR